MIHLCLFCTEENLQINELFQTVGVTVFSWGMPTVEKHPFHYICECICRWSFAGNLGFSGWETEFNPLHIHQNLHSCSRPLSCKIGSHCASWEGSFCCFGTPWQARTPVGKER